MNTTDKYLIVSDTPNMPPKDLDLREWVGYKAELWDQESGEIINKIDPDKNGEFGVENEEYPGGLSFDSGGFWCSNHTPDSGHIRRILNPDYQPEPLQDTQQLPGWANKALADLEAMKQEFSEFCDREQERKEQQLTREREMELHAQFMAANIIAMGVKGISSEKAAETAQADLDAYKAHWESK